MIDNQTIRKRLYDEFIKPTTKKKNLIGIEIEIPIIKDMLPDLRGKKVLDLGCGNGGMSKYFIEQGAESVLALDLSENMINEAREKNSDSKITYIVQGMENISKIDVVTKLFHECLHNIDK